MKGDRSEEMNDDRVVGGAGAKRIEVSRSGRSRFEVTYSSARYPAGSQSGGCLLLSLLELEQLRTLP